MPESCTIDECRRPRHARRMCPAHYARTMRYGDPRHGGPLKTAQGEPERWLKAKLEELRISPTEECVEWPFAAFADGYGSIWWDKKNARVPRVALGLWDGIDPPPELDVCHAPGVCHNGLCMNPAHLRWGTRADNFADKIHDGTLNRGESHGNAKITEKDVLLMRNMDKNGFSHHEIKVKFGISRSQVRRIVNRKQWKHV